MGIRLETGHEKQGIRAAYLDGSPGIRLSIYNQSSGLMFDPLDDLMFDPGTALMFDSPPATYPGIRIEVV